MKTTIALALIAALNFSLPVYAQTRPSRLPPKKVQTQTQFEEAPTVTTTAQASPSEDPLSRTETGSPDLKPKSDNIAAFRKPEGYPQNQLGANYEPNFFTLKWNYQGTEIKQSKSSPDGFGLVYQYEASPAFKAELAYSHNSYEVDSDSQNGLNLSKSSVNLDTVFLRADYSWIGAKRYFYGYGVGLEAGQDAFPTLEFTSANDLQIAKATDFVVGINAHAELFLLQPFSYQFKVGYDQGTRAPHLGGLTATKNRFYYAEAGTEYMIDENSSIQAKINYSVRNATVSGPVGGNEAEWDTDVNNTAFQIGYFHSL